MWDAKAIGKKGGTAKSVRKSDAARKNGAMGGRPPKAPTAEILKAAAAKNGPERALVRKHRLHYLVKLADAVVKLNKPVSAYTFFHVFWPLNEKAVRRELIRRERRTTWAALENLLTGWK